MTDEIKIGANELLYARALSARLKHLADRFEVEPCDPGEVSGGILIYTGGEGPVYDLLEIIEKMADKLEELEDD